MAENSTIEWTDATWNPVTGCTVVDAGCTNCYAMQLAGTRMKNHPSRAGLTRVTGGRPKWTGEVRLNEDWLDQPLRWTRPRMVFVCAHGDLFHENVPDEWIDRVFAVMALAPQHTFQVLTKRPDRARTYLTGLQQPRREREVKEAGRRAGILMGDMPVLGRRITALPLPNVWLGTSVSDQASADARIPDLLATPAAVRFVSAEPLLGPVDLRAIRPDGEVGTPWDEASADLNEWGVLNALRECPWPRLDWVIVGGESGRNARPMHLDWARSLRDQCWAFGVAFFFKQWGEWVSMKALPSMPGDETFWPDGTIGDGNANDNGGFGQTIRRVGKKAAGRLLDGHEWNQMPDPRT